MKIEQNSIYQGNCLDVLKQWDDAQVDMCVTSPPYWGLRNYHVDGQFGQEETPDQYIANMINTFREVKRILKDMGTCWVNIGDSYSGSGSPGGDWNEGRRAEEEKFNYVNGNSKQIGVRAKSLVGIPFRFAMAMIQDGWILRNTLIWYKPNCMPSSASDRFTIDFEYLFFFSKNEHYYFEQQFEQAYAEPWSTNSPKGGDYAKNNPRNHGKQKDFFGNNVKQQEKLFAPIGGSKQAGGNNPTYSGKTWIPKQLFMGEKQLEENYAYIEQNKHLEYDSKYKITESGQSVQGFGRLNTQEKERELSRIKAKELFPDDPKEQQNYLNFVHDHGLSGEVTFADKQADELGCSPSSGLRQKQKPIYMIRRNKRCVWKIPTEPSSEQHFACYPRELIRTPIKAGCPPNGLVLDPFFGSGTTGKVCQEEHRNYVGIELNPDYIKIAKRKLHLDYQDLTKVK